MSDDFYVGYVPRAPRRLGAWIRTHVILLVAGSMALALALTGSQRPFPTADFEYGRTRTFSGILREFPVPSLELENGRRALLVAPGKHGAAEVIRGQDGFRADLAGTRIQRDGVLMIEVTPGSIRRVNAPRAGADVWTSMGDVELRGEVVDSKCYLGVMNPGEGKVHRDCAVRCISGGVPPALVARDANGHRQLFLLTGAGGRPINREILGYIGEPVTVTGRLFRSDDRFRLETDVKSIRRVE